MKEHLLTAYVGTYTNGESEGIYSFLLDTHSGSIEKIKLSLKLENPTYLSLSTDKKYMYSVVKEDTYGGVAALKIDSSKRELSIINSEVLKGNPPCHLIMNNSSNYLFSANYHKGQLDCFKISDNKGIENLCCSIVHSGNGKDKIRQNSPHIHYVNFTPLEKYLYSIDLGLDKLSIYSFKNKKISEVKEKSLYFKSGCGPRHMIFHPNMKFAYIITELSSEIIALSYDNNGNFKEIQYVSTLPKDYSSENGGGAIKISNDGKFLYVSNRGHDSIAVFKINSSSGKIEFVQDAIIHGNGPRDFSLDPTGNFLVAAGQTSNTIEVLSVDKTTGKLEDLNIVKNIPSPVCIKFV
ncbi:MAG: lactonase family protein [Clostridium sp.]|nr:lactonase family protein [Clostridium sp.]